VVDAWAHMRGVRAHRVRQGERANSGGRRGCLTGLRGGRDNGKREQEKIAGSRVGCGVERVDEGERSGNARWNEAPKSPRSWLLRYSLGNRV
jgi:hypothetical protein